MKRHLQPGVSGPRPCIVLALACSLLFGTLSATARAATGASLIVDVVRATGDRAGEAVAVSVYHLAPERAGTVGASGRLRELGTGSTDAAGRSSITLDTTAVPAADLADAGAGTRDAFDVLIVARDAAQRVAAVSYAVVRLGITSRATAVESPRADLTPRTDRPVPPSGGATCTLGVCYSVEAHRYRYVRIAALNASQGLRATLTYAPIGSDVRQTRVGVAIRHIPLFGSGDWEAGGMMLERNERATVAPFRKSGTYHRFVWANYKEELRHYWSCDLIFCSQWDAWEPFGFAGQLTDDNPNVGPDSPRIGVRRYDQAPFPSNPNHVLRITPANSGWTRSQGQYKVFSWTLDAAGFLQLGAQATYGSSTSVRFDRIDGCEAPRARFVYGASEAPGLTPIVEARCVMP